MNAYRPEELAFSLHPAFISAFTIEPDKYRFDAETRPALRHMNQPDSHSFTELWTFEKHVV